MVQAMPKPHLFKQQGCRCERFAPRQLQRQHDVFKRGQIGQQMKGLEYKPDAAGA